VLEVSAKPHNGCAKFVARFGEEAMLFVNSEVGRELRLRGFNARVVESGPVRTGDVVRVVRRGGPDVQTAPGAEEALAI
jgi:MOSC domain-containing protein YiiM